MSEAKWWTKETEDGDAESIQKEPAYSLTTMKLISALRGGAIGDEITDEELVVICGKDCAPQAEGYGYLQSAIRYCERHGIVWRRLLKAKKIRRLNAVETLSYSDHERQGIHRRSKRNVRRLGSIERGDLDLGDQRRFDAALSQNATVAFLSGTKVRKELEDRCVNREVDHKAVLALFAPQTE